MDAEAFIKKQALRFSDESTIPSGPRPGESEILGVTYFTFV